MKMKFYGAWLMGALSLGAQAQQQPAGVPGQPPLPPGLQGREQLPADLTPQPPTPGSFPATQTNSALGPSSAGTNLATLGASNAWPSLTNRVEGALTNHVYVTNPPSASLPAARPRVTAQDEAATVADQNILVHLRKRVSVVVSASAAGGVHFLAREGVVTLVGVVPTQRESERLVELVERTPGVVQAINRIQVGAAPDATNL